MKTIRRVGLLALVLILSTGMIGASSFTSATLERDTNIDVVSDTNGVIALSDELAGDVVREDSSSGELKIDFTVGSATGVNVDSRYELGDPANPGSTPAFNITNQDSTSHTLSVNYTVTGTTDGGVINDGDSSNSTEFRVYNDAGSRVAWINEDVGSQSFTLGAGESAAVVVIVDTRQSDVDQNDDLSGTLNVTA